MIEESVEAFIVRYKPYAATVELLPRVEGSPLLECYTGKQVLRLFERTNPYLAKPGKVRLIINPSAEHLTASDTPHKALRTVALGQLAINGLLLERERHSAIVDAGLPLVVTTFEPIDEGLSIGDWVRCLTLIPIHGFVLPKAEQPGRHHEIDSDI